MAFTVKVQGCQIFQMHAFRVMLCESKNRKVFIVLQLVMGIKKTGSLGPGTVSYM